MYPLFTDFAINLPDRSNKSPFIADSRTLDKYLLVHRLENKSANKTTGIHASALYFLFIAALQKITSGIYAYAVI